MVPEKGEKEMEDKLEDAVEKAERFMKSDCRNYTRDYLEPIIGPLLAERAKNDVWKSADKCVNRAIVHYVSSDGRDYGQIDFHRELPKTKAREIAERYSCDTESCHHMIEGKYAVDIIESAILEAQGNQS